jgi:RND family efflux transporter MFP subunit
MIAFLVILYIGLLALLVRLKIVPWNAFWKVSPIIWLVLLFVVLFIPMNWGAPSGSVVVRRQSVAIVPNVAGEVIEVPVNPNVPLKAGDVLFRIDPAPYDAQVRQVDAQLKLAQIELERSTQLERTQAGTLATLQQRQANVDSLRAQLEAANWNLDKTVVRAPADGFVTNIALRKGARVAALPLSPVMAFIETDETFVGALVHQIYARNIAPGQAVELAFKFEPGRIYKGRVVALLQATALGQQQPGGTAVQEVDVQPRPFAVRIALDDPGLADRLPAGATGEAAIYTGSMRPTHIIRRVMIRMNTFLNYVIPF